jgi:hypothetical protein
MCCVFVHAKQPIKSQNSQWSFVRASSAFNQLQHKQFYDMTTFKKQEKN